MLSSSLHNINTYNNVCVYVCENKYVYITVHMKFCIVDIFFLLGQLYLAKTIDREKKDSYDITVVARDSGHPQQTSSATVNIIVLDANDNDPVFNMSQTTFEIPENANVSTLVATLNATDKDIGPNAQITFTNSDGWKGKFTMNRTTVSYLNDLDILKFV